MAERVGREAEIGYRAAEQRGSYYDGLARVSVAVAIAKDWAILHATNPRSPIPISATHTRPNGWSRSAASADFVSAFDPQTRKQCKASDKNEHDAPSGVSDFRKQFKVVFVDIV